MNENDPLEIILHDPGLSPMQRLWGAVIFRAFEDLVNDDFRAARFFKDRQSNFETACSFLKWDPERIRKMIKRLFKKILTCSTDKLSWNHLNKHREGPR